MCYAIPGRVVAIEGRTVTVEYFGELRKAHLVDGSAETGDYVYAQGGIIVSKVPEEEALPILETWKEQFFELKKVDAGLSSEKEVLPESVLMPIISKARSAGTLSRNEMLTVLDAEGDDLELLYSTANHVRKERLDNACCVHGIIEFSNHCQNDCLYCGIRCGNERLRRYRMTEEQILGAVGEAVEKHGFKALVLQSGEDPHYTDGMLVDLVKKIREKHGILLFMSIGERSKECYKRLYEAGAYGALLRFESSNPGIYKEMRPGKRMEDRIQLVKELKGIGFVVATGFLIGLPGQTQKDIVDDILLTKSLEPDMYSFGPLIPHPATPLASVEKPVLDDVLKAIALSRLVDSESKILVTSALETLAPDARKRGLLAGANSLMINTTPKEFQEAYDLYPGKAKEEPVEKTIKETVELLQSLGRAPTDLGV
jgi:biotin synthase